MGGEANGTVKESVAVKAPESVSGAAVDCVSVDASDPGVRAATPAGAHSVTSGSSGCTVIPASRMGRVRVS